MMGTNTSSEDNLEEQLGGVTGVNFGSAEYNWQKWYKDTLVKNLEQQATTKGYGVKYNADTGEVEIGKERTTVYDYKILNKTLLITMKPRFDESKSMDELLVTLTRLTKKQSKTFSKHNHQLTHCVM